MTVQGSVSVANPVQVTGTADPQPPVRFVSADTDPSRHVQVNPTLGGNAVPVAPGPLYFTDISWESFSTVRIELLESQSSDCSGLPSGTGLDLFFNTPQSGMRFFVAADRWLCVFSSSPVQVSVAGFRPY